VDRTSTITLIAETFEQDDYGVEHPVITRRDVYCQVDSVTRSEFFEAGRAGLNPEYRFTMFAGDYHGEAVCEYYGKRYAIYRTYFARNDNIELYVQREGGTNGK